MSIRRLFFRQQKGVTFEDETLSLPVSRDRIYPLVDRVKSALPKIPTDPTTEPLQWEPSPQSLNELDADVFLSIVRPWCTNAREDQEETIVAICRLHAAITRHFKEFSDELLDYLGHLHHLRWVVESVMEGHISDIELFLELHYTQHIRTVDDARVFKDCVVGACPIWAPTVVKQFNGAGLTH